MSLLGVPTPPRGVSPRQTTTTFHLTRGRDFWREILLCSLSKLVLAGRVYRYQYYHRQHEDTRHMMKILDKPPTAYTAFG